MRGTLSGCSRRAVQVADRSSWWSAGWSSVRTSGSAAGSRCGPSGRHCPLDLVAYRRRRSGWRARAGPRTAQPGERVRHGSGQRHGHPGPESPGNAGVGRSFARQRSGWWRRRDRRRTRTGAATQTIAPAARQAGTASERHGCVSLPVLGFPLDSPSRACRQPSPPARKSCTWARTFRPIACRAAWSTSTATPRRARPRGCARRSRPLRSRTSSAAPTPPRTASRSAWRSCWATRRRCSCPAARCATRSRSACTPARAATS